MQKWYESRLILNILILLMLISAIFYFVFQQQIGLPLFLGFGTVIMIRGVIKITMRMRDTKQKNQKHRRENEKKILHQIKRNQCSWNGYTP